MNLSSYFFGVITTGVLYFLSCTINPILYNLLSRKFRQAFKRTLCRCCLGFDVHSIPVLYRLKAKLAGGGGRPRTAVAVRGGGGGGEARNALLGPRRGPHRLYTKPACFRWVPESGSDNIRLAHVKPALGADGDGGGGNQCNPHGCRGSTRRYRHNAQLCTKETTCIGQDSSSSGAHAHSDGRLHRICRHKYCPNGRAAFGIGLTPPSIRTQSTSSGIRQQQMTPVSTLTPTRNSGGNSPETNGAHALNKYSALDFDAIKPCKIDKCRTGRMINSHPNLNHCSRTLPHSDASRFCVEEESHRTKYRNSAAISY